MRWNYHLILRIVFHPTLCQTCWACDHKITNLIGKDYYKDHHNCGELYRSEPLWRTLHEWAVVVSSSGVSCCGELHEWAVVVSSPWLSCCGELSTSELLWWALHEWAVVVSSPRVNRCGELSMSELLWWALHKWIIVVSSPWVSCCGNHPRSKSR